MGTRSQAAPVSFDGEGDAAAKGTVPRDVAAKAARAAGARDEPPLRTSPARTSPVTEAAVVAPMPARPASADVPPRGTVTRALPASLGASLGPALASSAPWQLHQALATAGPISLGACARGVGEDSRPPRSTSGWSSRCIFFEFW